VFAGWSGFRSRNWRGFGVGKNMSVARIWRQGLALQCLPLGFLGSQRWAADNVTRPDRKGADVRHRTWNELTFDFWRLTFDVCSRAVVQLQVLFLGLLFLSLLTCWLARGCGQSALTSCPSYDFLRSRGRHYKYALCNLSPSSRSPQGTCMAFVWTSAIRI